MNARLLFILLLFTIGALWYIIGYWRRKAGEAAFAAARLTEKSEERERYCRLAVMAGHREACRMFCLLHPERFDGHSPHKPFKLRGIRISFYGYYYPSRYNALLNDFTKKGSITKGEYKTLLILLNPVAPHITEELWQHIYDRKESESIMRAELKLDAPTADDDAIVAAIENVKLIVAGVRTVRNQKNIPNKDALELQALQQNNYEAYASVIKKMANLSAINVVSEKDTTAAAFMVGTDEFAVPLGDMIDVAAEIEKQEAQLKHLEGFLAGIKKKLSNEKFVAHAPEAVVALERKKQSDSEEKIAALKESIAALKNK